MEKKLTFITLPIFQERCKETMDYTLATSREAIICTKFFFVYCRDGPACGHLVSIYINDSFDDGHAIHLCFYTAIEIITVLVVQQHRPVQGLSLPAQHER